MSGPKARRVVPGAWRCPRFEHCMPWPLMAFCWLCHREHPPGEPLPERAALVCRLHDRVMTAWWTRCPRSKRKFDLCHVLGDGQ